MNTAIADFIADLRLAGRSGRTIEGHEHELKRLERWCEEHGRDWQQLTPAQLRQYTRLRAHLGHSSRANMLCTLRTFYRWAVESGLVALSPAAGLRTPARPRPLPRALTLDQVRMVLAALDQVNDRRGRRDRVLLLTALYSGMRAGELATLRWTALDLAGEAIGIELSKMNKGRAVPLHPVLVVELERWREVQGGESSWPVFSLDGRMFTPNRVGKICRRWRELAGVHFTAHQLRHTFATWALRNSGDLYAVSKALGHSRVQQTEIYLSADIDQVRKAIVRMPGIAGW